MLNGKPRKMSQLLILNIKEIARVGILYPSNNLPNFDDGYYVPTPKRTREPYPLPKVSVRDGIFCSSIDDVILENYESHPPIKAPLSN